MPSEPIDVSKWMTAHQNVVLTWATSEVPHMLKKVAADIVHDLSELAAANARIAEQAQEIERLKRTVQKMGDHRKAFAGPLGCRVCNREIWGEGWTSDTGETYWSHVHDNRGLHEDGSKVEPTHRAYAMATLLERDEARAKLEQARELLDDFVACGAVEYFPHTTRRTRDFLANTEPAKEQP